MHDSIFKLIILAGIIIICIGILWYTKKTKEGFEDATASGTLPLDASNPNLTPDQYYGSIALAATISLFKSHELTKATANPDNIPVSEGDPKTGAGAGMYITLTDIPPQTPPPDDIEVVLNKVTEGFLDEGFLAEGFIDAEQTANILAQNQANSIKAALTPEQLQARAQQEAQAKAQAIAEEKTATALSKTGTALKGIKDLKSAKNALMAAKASAKASAVAMKGAMKKAAQKVAGRLAGKVGAKIGQESAKAIAKKMIAKAAQKITLKAGLAMIAGTSLTANPLTLAFGIVMNVIAVVGITLGAILPTQFEDEGVCDPGWRRVSDDWPPYLDLIPGIGDIMGAMAPYMCSINQCEPDQDEDGGLCYPKCDGGYSGVGPICWTNNIGVGVGVLKGCPEGDWQDQGLICAKKSGQICGDDCGKGWDGCRRRGLFGECLGGCREGCSNIYLGELVGKFNNDSRLKCPSDHPEEVDGLCYKPCPMVGGEVTTVTKVYPIYVKKLPSVNQDAAQQELSNAISDKSTSPETITKLQEALGMALVKDSTLPMDPKAPYIRNPAGPRIGSEPEIAPKAPRRWPATETPQYNDLLAGIENGKVVFYSASMGGWQTFESIYGSYGKQLTKDGRKAVKVTMSAVGPQIITDVDGRCYRWNTEKVDWEWNTWGNFKDLAAANNSFTYFMGTNDRPYYYRWKGNPRGLGDSGGEAHNWWAMIGIAANDFASGYSNKDRDTGNMFSTNPSGWEAIIRNWDSRYLWGNDKTYDKDKYGEATDVAMGQNDQLRFFIATKKGYIFTSSGIDVQNKNIIEGPVIGTPITAITADENNIVYIICGGKLYVQAPVVGPQPQKTISEIIFVNDPCATKLKLPWGEMCQPFFGPKATGKMVPNPDYDTQNATWVRNNAAVTAAVNGWIEIIGKTVTDIAIGPPVINDQFTAYNNYKAYNDMMQREVYSKYPIPMYTVDQEKVETLSETIVHDPRKKLRRIPLIPFQCMGDRGIAYGRGVGQPKLKTKMVSKKPPPPPPPASWLSSGYADDPATPFFADFSNPVLLQSMCAFYYKSNIAAAEPEEDGSISYSYITKIVSVIASSEQSVDVICEMTNTSVNSYTGELLYTNVVPNNDRRFYFAKIVKTSTFVVTGCTNINGTGPYATASGALIKTVGFTPTLEKCINKPITMEKCSDPKTIDLMINLYRNNPLGNIRTKTVTAIENTGANICSVAWTETMFDKKTNAEAIAVNKSANFIFTQNKTNDGCVYSVSSFTPVDTTKPIKPLDTPIVYATPPVTEAPLAKPGEKLAEEEEPEEENVNLEECLA